MDNWKEKIENLKEKNLSIQVEKNGKLIYQSQKPMLKPLFLCLTEHRREMEGSTVIDKIVGQAAAYICVLAKVKRVLTPVASQSACDVLKENNIELKALRIIPQIMNRDNTDQCPMEKLAVSSGSPKKFYQELESRILV